MDILLSSSKMKCHKGYHHEQLHVGHSMETHIARNLQNDKQSSTLLLTRY